MRFTAPLHGLRGVAALVVLLTHYGNGGDRMLPFPHDHIGKVGVWMFFVLSAYLLSTKVQRASDMPGYILQRVFRIYPLYIAVLLLHWMAGGITAGRLLPHILLLQGQYELWAIPVEFRFYLAAPLVGILAAHAGARQTAFVVATIGVISLATPPVYVFGPGIEFLPRLFPFAAGAFIALLQPRIPYAAWIGLAGLAIGAFMFRQHILGLSSLPSHLISIWLALAAAITTLGVQSGIAAKIFGSRPMVWLGEISFGVYLLHIPAWKAAHLLGFGPWIATAITLALAAIAHLCLEAPAIRLGKRLSVKIRGSRNNSLGEGLSAGN